MTWPVSRSRRIRYRSVWLICELVVLRVLDLRAGVDPGGHAVDPVDLAAVASSTARSWRRSWPPRCRRRRCRARVSPVASEQGDDGGERDDAAATAGVTTTGDVGLGEVRLDEIRARRVGIAAFEWLA